MNLKELSGKFITYENGKVEVLGDKIADEVEFHITASRWENVNRHVGVRQEKCSTCDALVGISPSTQEILRQRPATMILCTPCWMSAVEAERLGSL